MVTHQSIQHLDRRIRFMAKAESPFIVVTHQSIQHLDRRIRFMAKAESPFILRRFLEEGCGETKQNLAKSFVRSWALSQSIEIREVGAWCNMPTEQDEPPLLTWEQVQKITYPAPELHQL